MHSNPPLHEVLPHIPLHNRLAVCQHIWMNQFIQINILDPRKQDQSMRVQSRSILMAIQPKAVAIPILLLNLSKFFEQGFSLASSFSTVSGVNVTLKIGACL
jgi:hypothetical protein